MAYCLTAVAGARSFGTAHKGLRLHRGTFYFDKGEYMTPLAGLTQLCPQPQDGAPRPPSIGCTPSEAGVVRFSAYRIHGSDDPLLFDAVPFAVTWRNGEPGHGGRAYAVNASSLALVYEW